VGRWQVSFFRNGKELVQVQVDDRSGAILEQWSGYQVAWRMARGYSGAFGRKLNAPYVWIPLCLLFLVPFVDFRRPLRLLHLDLLVLLGFGASHVFFNRGDIGVSVPLVYPVLLYLLVRMLLAGLRPRERPGRLVPHVPITWLAVALVALVGFRVTLNLVDSNVIDVGYAGVIGADRIVDGDPLYGEGFSEDVGKGDTYGPVNYLLYVPFEQAMPWSGRWDDLPAAHGAAILFDLLTIGGLLLLGRALRPGREGTAFGVALAYAWAAFPYTAFALETNSNDTLVALACTAALLAFARRSAAGAGLAVGLGAASKFAPLALAPLFARRRPLVFALVLAATLALAVIPFVPDGGLRELYDRTLGYQASRGSPFSIWGQTDLDWLQTLTKVGGVGLALLVAIVPRRAGNRQVAALGAAVLIALQLPVNHWFYLYVVWFLPFVLVASFGAIRPQAPAAGKSTWHARPTRLPPAPHSATGPRSTSRSAPA
jgi:glycosyl transferase family 87